MNKELIIRSSSSGVDFAFLSEGELYELHKEEETNDFCVGDIMFSHIKKNVQGLNASFVDVGYKKDAFLHYNDLGQNIYSILNFVKLVTSNKLKDFSLKNFPSEKTIEKDGNVVDIVKSRQPVLVQITKEPISTKGPRITCEISIAGRYIILVPFSKKISLSQKIEDTDERDRLTKLMKSIKPKGFGVIIRTVAQNKMVAELDADLNFILDKWNKMCQQLQKNKAPSKVLKEVNKTSSILRDFFNDNFSAIHVNDEQVYEEIKEQLLNIAPDKDNIVKLYKSQVPIFEKFGIERQIKSSFGKVVTMNKGAYLVIEHTEALHVIDVNSGRSSNNASSQQGTALEVNLIAAKEIAKQLRLRDMGGIIVVDFIDMNIAEDRKNLYDFLKEEMSTDRAKHKILPPSKFGLIQITRQRVRPERNIKTQEKDPNNDKNNIDAPIVVIDKITYDLDAIIQNNPTKKDIFLNIHPFVGAYITKGGINSVRFKWFRKYKKWVKIIPRNAYTYLEYNFKDKEGKIIK